MDSDKTTPVPGKLNPSLLARFSGGGKNEAKVTVGIVKPRQEEVKQVAKAPVEARKEEAQVTVNVHPITGKAVSIADIVSMFSSSQAPATTSSTLFQKKSETTPLPASLAPKPTVQPVVTERQLAQPVVTSKPVSVLPPQATSQEPAQIKKPTEAPIEEPQMTLQERRRMFEKKPTDNSFRERKNVFENKARSDPQPEKNASEQAKKPEVGRELEAKPSNPTSTLFGKALEPNVEPRQIDNVPVEDPEGTQKQPVKSDPPTSNPLLGIFGGRDKRSNITVEPEINPAVPKVEDLPNEQKSEAKAAKPGLFGLPILTNTQTSQEADPNVQKPEAKVAKPGLFGLPIPTKTQAPQEAEPSDQKPEAKAVKSGLFGLLTPTKTQTTQEAEPAKEQISKPKKSLFDIEPQKETVPEHKNQSSLQGSQKPTGSSTVTKPSSLLGILTQTPPAAHPSAHKAESTSELPRKQSLFDLDEDSPAKNTRPVSGILQAFITKPTQPTKEEIKTDSKVSSLFTVKESPKDKPAEQPASIDIPPTTTSPTQKTEDLPPSVKPQETPPATTTSNLAPKSSDLLKTLFGIRPKDPDNLDLKPRPPKKSLFEDAEPSPQPSKPKKKTLLFED